ncbi:MAG: hypothetical protein V4616_13140 [Bacteroidota bacterium]
MKEVKDNQQEEDRSEIKTIHDLSTLSAAEIQTFVRQNWGKRIFGRFTDNSGQRVLVAVTDSKFFSRKRFTAALAVQTFGI